MKELILNADDFGLTEGVNDGIIRAHREGVLTSTTLMANGLAFDHAVECARANPNLGVGCHLVLAGGVPVAPPEEIPSLVDGSGRMPRSLPAFVVRVSVGAVRAKDMEREFRAQIGKIRSAGIEPTHLDTHKHTHAHPRVMEVLAQVAQDLGITRVRKPAEYLHDSWRVVCSDAWCVANTICGGCGRALALRELLFDLEEARLALAGYFPRRGGYGTARTRTAVSSDRHHRRRANRNHAASGRLGRGLGANALPLASTAPGRTRRLARSTGSPGDRSSRHSPDHLSGVELRYRSLPFSVASWRIGLQWRHSRCAVESFQESGGVP